MSISTTSVVPGSSKTSEFPADPAGSSRYPRKNADLRFETYMISDSWQLFDEIVFIIRRNLGDICFSAFIAAIPKLIFTSAVFVWPDLLYLFGIGSITFATGIMAALHQIFWRPLAWISISGAFLSGYPDHRVRRQAIKSNGWQAYLSILAANLLTAVFFSGTLWLFIGIYLDRNISSDLQIPALIVWFFIWICTLFKVPYKLIYPAGKPGISLLEKQTGFFRPVFSLSLRFSILLAILYTAITGSSIYLLSLIGISINTGFAHLPPDVFILCLLISADCLIDPLIIGYRLLLSRLCIEKD
jgi:hypothetical protein